WLPRMRRTNRFDAPAVILHTLMKYGNYSYMKALRDRTGERVYPGNSKARALLKPTTVKMNSALRVSDTKMESREAQPGVILWYKLQTNYFFPAFTFIPILFYRPAFDTSDKRRLSDESDCAWLMWSKGRGCARGVGGRLQSRSPRLGRAELFWAPRAPSRLRHRRLANTGGPHRLQSFVGPAVYSHSLHFWSFTSSPSSLGGCLSLSPGFCGSQFGVGTVSGAAGPHKLHTLLKH
ncbi:hypothetical protein KUCAC02_023216, partial [Chaenocephalus aceratus]